MKYFLSIIILVVFCLSATAQDASSLRKKHFNLESSLAIKGYDPVVYFTQNKAVKGKKNSPYRTRVFCIIFHQKPIKKLLKQRLLNTSRSTAAGVPMPWAKKEKKFLLTPKHLK